MNSITLVLCTALLALSNCITHHGPCPAENRGVCISEVQLLTLPPGDIGASVELYVQSMSDGRDLFVRFDTLSREKITIPVPGTGSSHYRLITASLHLTQNEAVAVLVATDGLGVLDGLVVSSTLSSGATTLANRFGVRTIEVGSGSVSVSRCGQNFKETSSTLGRENLCKPIVNVDKEEFEDPVMNVKRTPAVTINEVIKKTTIKDRLHKTPTHHPRITQSTSRRSVATTLKTPQTSTKKAPTSTSKPSTRGLTKSSSMRSTASKTRTSKSTKRTTPKYQSTTRGVSTNPSTSITTMVHTTLSSPHVTPRRTSTLPPSSSSSDTNKPSPSATKAKTTRSGSSLRTPTTTNSGSSKATRSSQTTSRSPRSSVKLSSDSTTRSFVNPSSTLTTKSSVNPSSTITTKSFTSPSSTTPRHSVNTHIWTTASGETKVTSVKETTAKFTTETSVITKHSTQQSTETSAQSSTGPTGTNTATPIGGSSTLPSLASTTGPSGGPPSGPTSRLSTRKSTSAETTGTTGAPYSLTVSISEVNTLIEKNVNKTFIELQGPHHMTLVHHSLVVYDGQSGATLFHRRFLDNDTFTGSGFFLLKGFQISRLTKCILIGLYDNRKWLQPYGKHVPVSEAKGLLDSFAIRTTTDTLNADIMENLLPTHADRVFTIKPRLAEEARMTVSRCANTLMDPGSFLLSFPTPGASNNCTLGTGHRIQFKLIDADCNDFRNPKLQVALVDYLVKSVNHRCMCGLTHVLVTERKYMCGSLIFEAYIRASTDWQANAFFSSYHDFVTDTTKSVVIGGERYTADTSCIQDCMPPVVNPDNKSPGDTTLTVAIVVSCVGAFMIVAIGVVIYIRRKKRSIVTFRLTNLGEMDTSNMLHEDRDDIVEEDQSTFRSIALVTA